MAIFNYLELFSMFLIFIVVFCYFLYFWCLLNVFVAFSVKIDQNKPKSRFSPNNVSGGNISTTLCFVEAFPPGSFCLGTGRASKAVPLDFWPKSQVFPQQSIRRKHLYKTFCLESVSSWYFVGGKLDIWTNIPRTHTHPVPKVSPQAPGTRP